MRDLQPFIPKPPVARHAPALLPAAVLAPARAATIAVHAYAGQRVPWHGTVAALVPGASTPAVPTALHLTNIVDDKNVCVWAAVWLRYTGYLRQFDLQVGDRVTFVARVDRQLDGTYTLNRPTHFARVTVAAVR